MKILYKVVAPILTALMWIGLILFTTVTVNLLLDGTGEIDTTIKRNKKL